jgi:hypothetical protein
MSSSVVYYVPTISISDSEFDDTNGTFMGGIYTTEKKAINSLIDMLVEMGKFEDIRRVIRARGDIYLDDEENYNEEEYEHEDDEPFRELCHYSEQEMIEFMYWVKRKVQTLDMLLDYMVEIADENNDEIIEIKITRRFGIDE